jgi:hypothetical protein
MKNNLIIFKLLLSLFIFSVLLTGCVEKNIISDGGVIRYQKIPIPGFEQSDYENMLSSDNSEVIHNSICNLVRHAHYYAETLNKEGSLKNSKNKELPTIEELEAARKVLNFVIAQLSNDNDNIKTASLIFISEFAPSYSKKEDLLKVVEKVEAKNLRTQYEHILSLIKLSNSKTIIDKDLIEEYLDSSSWKIKSMTYLLLGIIPSEDFHKVLIKEYKDAKQNYNKLLLINTFRNSHGPKVFHLLKKELMANGNKKIKKEIIDILKKNTDKHLVIKWIVRSHTDIDKDTLQSILDDYYFELESSVGTTFFNELLSPKNESLIALINQNKLFESLYNAKKKEPFKSGLVELEEKIQKNLPLYQAWLSYNNYMGKKESKGKEALEREKMFEKILLPQYNIMLEYFLADTRELFSDGGMEKEEIDEATESIKELLNILSKDKEE